DPDIKRFNILAFNVGATWLEPNGWFDNTKAGRQKALSQLDGIVLEGATDLSTALTKLADGLGKRIEANTRVPFVDVFLLSDGQITWGEPDVSRIVAKFENRCPFSTR